MPASSATANQTVPTGLPGTAPPGPAIAGHRDGQRGARAPRRAPSAIARATCSETAPCSAISARVHAQDADLHLVRVRDDRAQEHVRSARRRR